MSFLNEYADQISTIAAALSAYSLLASVKTGDEKSVEQGMKAAAGLSAISPAFYAMITNGNVTWFAESVTGAMRKHQSTYSMPESLKMVVRATAALCAAIAEKTGDNKAIFEFIAEITYYYVMVEKPHDFADFIVSGGEIEQSIRTHKANMATLVLARRDDLISDSKFIIAIHEARLSEDQNMEGSWQARAYSEACHNTSAYVIKQTLSSAQPSIYIKSFVSVKVSSPDLDALRLSEISFDLGYVSAGLRGISQLSDDVIVKFFDAAEYRLYEFAKFYYI